MPEQIQPGGSIASGYFTSSVVGPTGAEALADALRATSKTVTTISDTMRDKELEKVEDLLNSPTITDQEIREIELNAKFPMARLKAENRRGTVMAEQNREDVTVRLRNAKDAIEARQILRDAQEELLLSADTDGVRAGIRQRFSEYAPRLIEDASARRLADREREDILNTDTDLRLRLDSDPGQFADAYVGHATDEKLANGDMKAFHERGAATVYNHYLEGEKLGSPGSNPHTGDSLEAIDSILKAPLNMTASDRDGWLAVRSKIIGDEEAARRTLAAGGGAHEKKVFMQFQGDALEWKRRNPHAPTLPEALAKPLLAAVYSPESQRMAFDLINGDPNAGGEKMRRGVADTDTWQSVRSRLSSSMSVSAFAQSDDWDRAEQAKAEALREFDAAALAIPKELADDPEKLMALGNRLADQASARSAQWRTDSEARTKRAQEETKALSESIGLAQTAGNPEAVRILQEKRAAAQAEYVDREWRANISQWLRLNNVDLDRTHFVP